MDIAHTEATKSAVDALFDSTELIDMTPDAKPPADVKESSTELTKTTQSTALASLNRTETTAKHVGDVLEKSRLRSREIGRCDVSHRLSRITS